MFLLENLPQIVYFCSFNKRQSNPHFHCFPKALESSAKFEFPACALFQRFYHLQQFQDFTNSTKFAEKALPNT
jgi:hypothetical protein